MVRHFLVLAGKSPIAHKGARNHLSGTTKPKCAPCARICEIEISEYSFGASVWDGGLMGWGS